SDHALAGRRGTGSALSGNSRGPRRPVRRQRQDSDFSRRRTRRCRSVEWDDLKRSPRPSCFLRRTRCHSLLERLTSSTAARRQDDSSGGTVSAYCVSQPLTTPYSLEVRGSLTDQSSEWP